MALGCHGANEVDYGAADAAWNDSESVYSRFSISAIPPDSQKSSASVNRGRPSKGDTKISGSSSAKKESDHSLSLAVTAARCFLLDLPPALLFEIFTHLDARELAVVSCVCTVFRRLSADSHGWKDFYCERWALPLPSKCGETVLPGKHWRELYVAREATSKAMMGRFTMDMLHGHTAGVRCVRALPDFNLICSAGYDQTVRLWNMEEGLPISCSRALGDTIRSIAIDSEMLAVAGTEAVLRLWHANSATPHLFDIAGSAVNSNTRGSETLLYGHTGPVTCLGMDGLNLYSGSWDMSVKVWSRSSLKCVETLRHMDWVWALVQRGRRVFSTAGSDLYSWDVETAQLLRVRRGVHSGQAYGVQGTRSGQIAFTGGEDGCVRMFDDRVSKRRSSLTDVDNQESDGQEAEAIWHPHSTTIYSLAFDDPWLVTASGDGSLAMIDVRQFVRRAGGTKQEFQVGTSSRRRRPGRCVVSKEISTAHRWLSGVHQSAYSVDIGGDRIVSGGDERIVRIWDFSQALEVEKRVQASRSIQIENRLRRRQASTEYKGKHANLGNVARKNEAYKIRGAPHGPGRENGKQDNQLYPLLSLSKSESCLASRGPMNGNRVRYVDSVSVPS